jgi:hypothetical protein
MKRFIKKIILFAFICLAPLTLVQVIVSYRIRDRILYGSDNLDQTSNINADLVFLGSSRCCSHFDPAFFDTNFHLKSANIGVDGHSELAMAIIRFKNYLSKNKAPKFVIINFDPLCDAGSFTNTTNLFEKPWYARYAFMPGKNNLPFVNYFKFDAVEKYVPLYALCKYKILKDCFTITEPTAQAKFGYNRHDEPWDTIDNPISSIGKKSFINSSSEKSTASMLDSLNRLCLENHSKLLCIQTPMYKAVWDSAAFVQTRKICSDLNIPYIDANASAIGNDIENFYNVFHMNTNGVRKMNTILAADSTLTSFLD